jgi:aminoglycoside phosphotransferase (APT) family kinase protein
MPPPAADDQPLGPAAAPAEVGRADLAGLIKRAGLVASGCPRLIPLSGGVSSEIYRVEEEGQAFVVKRALSKLRVEDDWHADPARNRYEHRYLSVVDRIVPGAVPRVLHTDDDGGWFAMEWLGEGWRNWKTDLLAGMADATMAAEAGRLLGVIHRETCGSRALRSEFDTDGNFYELRLDPYLLTTGRRHPRLEQLFLAEAQRIASTRECLVHGDFSPKNMLLREGRLVLLDCEVAWYGDPRFDLAFLLNHLHLKALYHAPDASRFAPLCAEARRAYAAARDWDEAARARFESSTAGLLLMLMLARVDGKSPVEYLAVLPSRSEFVRRFVNDHLPADGVGIEEITQDWFRRIAVAS